MGQYSLRVSDIERAAFVFAVTCIVSSVLSFIAGAVGSLLQDKSAIVVASSSALISGTHCHRSSIRYLQYDGVTTATNSELSLSSIAVTTFCFIGSLFVHDLVCVIRNLGCSVKNVLCETIILMTVYLKCHA